MNAVIIIALIICILLIVTVLTNPHIKIGEQNIYLPYWAVPVLGALIFMITGLLPINIVWNGLTEDGGINPLKILVLFISMTTLSIFLDEAGMFSYLASIALKKAGVSQLKLFILLFAMVSVLTVFTSNDIIILTFTPFICYFSKKANINPIPYLFGEFVAANTWSMMLIIGNPTNIYLASSQGITFGSYTFHMLVPTFFAGITALILLLLVFRKQLSKPLELNPDEAKLDNKPMVIIGVIHLALCTILLVISSYINLEMWYITLGFAVSLFICIGLYQWIVSAKSGKKIYRRQRILLHTITRAPFELIPFVLSMFIIVLALEQYQVTGKICELLGQDLIIAKYGIASFLSANIMNNIPMAVAFASIGSNLPDTLSLKASYASIIGSNIGAYLSPLGALAGIMWTGILKKMGVDFSFKSYLSYGIRISIPVLLMALLGLMIML